jgi:hypothetical protein
MLVNFHAHARRIQLPHRNLLLVLSEREEVAIQDLEGHHEGQLSRQP